VTRQGVRTSKESVADARMTMAASASWRFNDAGGSEGEAVQQNRVAVSRDA